METPSHKEFSEKNTSDLSNENARIQVWGSKKIQCTIPFHNNYVLIKNVRQQLEVNRTIPVLAHIYSKHL